MLAHTIILASAKGDENGISVQEKGPQQEQIQKDSTQGPISDFTEDEYPLPTEEESSTLRKVGASLPLVSFSLCLVEFAERASYYGAKTVFSNFIQFPLPEGESYSGQLPDFSFYSFFYSFYSFYYSFYSFSHSFS